MNWDLEYFVDSRGKRPVDEFLNTLPLSSRLKVNLVLDLLREFGTMLNRPHVRKIVGTKLWEVRTGGEVPVRILYVAKAGRKFLLLHGFVKKTQKTPDKEISLATRRLGQAGD